MNACDASRSKQRTSGLAVMRSLTGGEYITLHHGGDEILDVIEYYIVSCYIALQYIILIIVYHIML